MRPEVISLVADDKVTGRWSCFADGRFFGTVTGPLGEVGIEARRIWEACPYQTTAIAPREGRA